jgi:hypothetical protein
MEELVSSAWTFFNVHILEEFYVEAFLVFPFIWNVTCVTPCLLCIILSIFTDACHHIHPVLIESLDIGLAEV